MNRRRMLMQLKSKNLLKNKHLGFIDSSGKAVIASTRPYSYYYDDVKLEVGKTYRLKIDFKIQPTDVNDGCSRLRMFDANRKYLGGVTKFDNTAQHSVKVYAESGLKYQSDEFIITPTSDCILVLLFLASTQEWAENNNSVVLEEV